MIRKIINTIIILFAISVLMFSGQVMAAEDVAITSLEIDLSSILVIRGEKPKYFDYENEQYIIDQEWYHASEDANYADNYILESTKVEQFDDSFDTAYACVLTITPKEGYKFEDVPNYSIYGLNWRVQEPSIVDGKLIFNIFCKASEEYNVTINNGQIDATITINGEEVKPGQTIKAYSPRDYKVYVKADEGYRISKIETISNGETSVELAKPKQEFYFYIGQEEDTEIIITTEKVIEHVKVNGLIPPVIGETGEDLPLTVPDSVDYKIVGYYWNIVGEGQKLQGERFKVDKEYSLCVVISSPTRFAHNDSAASEHCTATIEECPADIESITKEDTNYYMVMSAYLGYPIPPRYDFINNTENQTYVKGVDKTLTFKIDAEYSLFNPDGIVYIDGEELLEEYYTHKEGSVEITLTEEFMNTLEPDEYFIDVLFSNYGYATTTFIVEEQKNTSIPDNPIQQPDNTIDNTTNNTVDNTIGTNTEIENTNTTNTNSEAQYINPKTGDNIIFYVLLLAISVTGVLAITQYRKNAKK